MIAKLLAQMFLSGRGPRKNHQPTRLTIQTMHGPNVPWRSAVAMRFSFCNDPGQQLVECRLKLPFAWRKPTLIGMSSRSHARRLFDHNNMLVDIADANIVFPNRRGHRVLQQFNHIDQPQTLAGVGANVAVDGHAARL